MNFVLVLFFISVTNFSRCFSSGVCIGQGESCLTAPGGCCDGLTCSRYDWKCEGASPFTPPQCQQLNQNCGSYYSCCNGLTCQSGQCVERESSCIKRGLDCDEGSYSCCAGLRCTAAGGSRYCLPNTPTPTKPNCQSRHQLCDSNEQCCYGLTCSENSGTCESPAPTPSTPCIQKGLDCVQSPNGCCESLHCVRFNGDWSCQPKTTPTPPPYPGCRYEHEYCGDWYGKCCSGLTCSNGGTCESAPTPRPGPPCIQQGLNCVTAPNACCRGLSCVGSDNGWFCLPDTPPPSPTPGCRHRDYSCESDNECCRGLTCYNGRCDTIPSPSPSSPCIEQGVNCLTAPHGCCEGLRCDAGDSWQCVPDTPETTTPYSCQTLDSFCDSEDQCCSGLTCSDDGMCKSSPTPQPCLSKEERCEVDGTPCCTGTKCTTHIYWLRYYCE